MLNQFREHHKKRILWILAAIIIVAFGLSGAGFYPSGREKGMLGKIGNKIITAAELRDSIRMAQIQVLLSRDDPPAFTPIDFERIGLDFLVLLWKAEQEKIEAKNQEVKAYILENIFNHKKFDSQTYENFLAAISRRYNLGLTARDFEEYIRAFIKIDKLFKKYTDIEVKPEEVKELYLRNTQEAKIGYLKIPYEKFKVDVGIAPSDTKKFYADNKSFFEEEAKVNIAYVLLENNHPQLAQIIQALAEIKTLKDLKAHSFLEIKETGLIKLSDPIKEIGWQQQINQIAFSLEENTLSPPLEIEKGILIMEKIDARPAFIPPITEIEDQVKKRFILERAKKDAESFAQELLGKIQSQNLKNLQKFAAAENLEYKETAFFKFDDYIEGLGLDLEISAVVFLLKKDEITFRIFLRDDAAYIVQLKEISEFNEKDFQEREPGYRNFITQNKLIVERLKVMERIKQEADLQFNLQSKLH